MPVLLVRTHGIAQRVQFVHVRIEMRGHVEAVVVQLRELKSQVDREQVPVHRVGSEVITSVDG